jgi:hypothetical protein
MASLAYDWGLMGWGMRAIVIALAVALILVVLSPHVAVLKPIAQGLGLTTTKYVYVPVNHTVYVNRTVYVPPQWLSSLGAVTSGHGYCSGRLVVLPNNTAWFVWFWLVPSQYAEQLNPFSYPYYLIWYNATTHSAVFFRWVAYELVSQGMNYMGSGACYISNVTINGYYVAVCGDTRGLGPMNTIEYPISAIIPPENATYSVAILLSLSGPAGYINIYHTNTVIACNVTVTYASNATAALWLPVTTNQTLFNYFKESLISLFGFYDPYDNTIGHWVWFYPR